MDDNKTRMNLHSLINRYLVADTPTPPLKERVKSAAGTALGVAAVFGITYLVFGNQYAMLTAVGASAVIMFAIPHSPMAQPWSVIGGYLVAVSVGLLVQTAMVPSIPGVAVAIVLVVLLTMTLKCLHPPAGAIIVFVFNQHPQDFQTGLMVLASVMLSALLLVILAMVLNNLGLGRKYPQCLAEPIRNLHRTRDQPPTLRTGVTHEDLDYALKKHGTYVDIQEAELIDLYETAIDHAFSRKMNTRCGDIMARDVISITDSTGLDEAWRLLHQHKIKALPVINAQRQVIGIVTVADFLKDVATKRLHYRAGLENLVHGDQNLATDRRPVSQIMTQPVVTEQSDALVALLIKKLSDLGMHHVPIVNGQQELVGMITQSDLIGSMYQKIVLNAK